MLRTTLSVDSSEELEAVPGVAETVIVTVILEEMADSTLLMASLNASSTWVALESEVTLESKFGIIVSPPEEEKNIRDSKVSMA